MKTLTLFDAYTLATGRRNRAATGRGSIHGIAVRDDYYSKYWQRYDRLARKLRQHIRARLGAPKLDTCWLCGYWASACSCSIDEETKRKHKAKEDTTPTPA